MSTLFEKRAASRGGWVNFAPLPVALLIMGLESMTINVRLAPSMLMISLAIFSLFLSPRVMLFWVLVFSIPTLSSLIFVKVQGYGEKPAIVVLRITSWLISGGMAVAISSFRLHYANEFNKLLRIFDMLPVALVISDNDGNILFANKSCSTLLARDHDEITSLSYFSLFSDPQFRGREIERYLTLFNFTEKSSTINLHVQSQSATVEREAKCYPIKINRTTYLITQF